MPQAISNRYAQALADAVFAAGSGVDPRQASTELHAFEDTVRSVAEFEDRSPFAGCPFGAQTCGGGPAGCFVAAFAVGSKFPFVLVDRRRSDLLTEIAPAYDAAVDERLGLVRAEVTSAAPLSEAHVTELENALSQVAGRRVRAEYQVDPSLIGGVIARIGSTVYDGSVRSQLQAMRQTLVS